MHRVGLGHDTHRLGPGRPLAIGGVVVPHDVGPIAHSDGDVLLHALIDALLGAAGLGDIGDWFPDTDPAHANADSTNLLEPVLLALRERGWRVGNVDCTVHAQRPKLSPHKEAIAGRIAELLGVSRGQVNVKAKTGESVGPVGRGEAISADVAVLLENGDWPGDRP
ncbi:MAG: 2-C-methyl-D-erythritol 2,4-cyclodiphosphate synthase [Planctomyces sp.]|nr:2-C-methyl-D-erythritol 2,4-cyclodiphosphate synthase [Planctomyces sp.]